MKKFLLAYCIFFGLAASASEQRDSVYVKQVIKYQCENAETVYLVWGLNEWYEPPAELLPEGSYVNGGIAYTPMQKHDGVFECTLTLERKCQLDFLFRIDKDVYGNELEIFDSNVPPFKDYHTLLYNPSTLLINASIELPVAENFSILNFSGYFSIGTTALFAGFLFLGLRRKQSFVINSKRIIIASSLAFFLIVLFVRPAVTGFGDKLITGPLDYSVRMFPAAYYDFLFIASIASIFLLINFLFRKIQRVRIILAVLFVLVCFSSLIFAILNVKVVSLLGKPLNYQWLYYADFLKSSDSRLALSENTSGDYLKQISLISLSFFLLLYSFLSAFSLLKLSGAKLRYSYLGVFLLAGVYVVTARSYINSQKWEYDKLANPVTAFLSSVNPFSSPPSLFTMSVNDTLKYIPRRENISPVGSGEIKNVLIYVLESVPAEYVSVYDSMYKVTPVLEKYKEQSLIFENVYAHAPATNLSMVSLLCSAHPLISYNSVTEEYPDIPLTSIVNVLKQKGYASSFFNSADNRFQSAGEFLEARGFDVIRDCNSNNDMVFHADEGKWKYMGGKTDSASAIAMCDWIGSVKNKNWFSMMWTYQTHYPYFVTNTEKFYSGNADLNRYLNALNNSDKVLGQIIKYLEDNDLSKSTLIVVVGDHGEAFGRHGQITHARMVYEENLHIPCVFIHPSFSNKRFGGVGGMVDVSPTILDLLGFKQPAGWQGEGLTRANRFERTFFFAPWSDNLFGYREKNMKYIYNATKDKTEVYDLSNDRLEENNLSAQFENQIPIVHQRLAGWAQFVNRSIEQALALKKKKTNNF